MRAREVQIMGDASLRNLALISSMPVALFIFRLLSCVSMKANRDIGNAEFCVFRNFFSDILV